MVLREWLEEWMNHYIKPKRAASTISGYQCVIRQIPRELMEQDINQAKIMTYQAMIDKMAIRKPRQAQIMYAALHCAMARAERIGVLERNFMRRVDKPQHRQMRPVILTREELLKYMDHARKIEDCGAALLLMAACGLRRGEALGLMRHDLDQVNGIIYIRRQRQRDRMVPLKSASSSRALPVPGWMMDLLLQKGEMITEVGTTKLYKRHQEILRAAQLPTVTLHGLRHSWATCMIEQGAGISTVQHYLGHSAYTVTDRAYVHRTNGLLQQAIPIMDRMMRGA